MDKKNNIYDDGFDYVHENIDKSLDNFDDENKMSRRKTASKNKKTKVEDYGDNFNSQTGEDNDDYVYENTYDINSASYYKNKSGKGKNKKTNSATVIGLVVCAVICVVFAIVFALTQCTDGSSALKVTTTPAINEATTVVTAQAETTQDVHVQVTVRETEALIVTEAPTEAVTTQSATEMPTTQVPAVTEPSVQEEVPTTVVKQTESDIDQNLEDIDI